MEYPQIAPLILHIHMISTSANPWKYDEKYQKKQYIFPYWHTTRRATDNYI